MDLQPKVTRLTTGRTRENMKFKNSHSDRCTADPTDLRPCSRSQALKFAGYGDMASIHKQWSSWPAHSNSMTARRSRQQSQDLSNVCPECSLFSTMAQGS